MRGAQEGRGPTVVVGGGAAARQFVETFRRLNTRDELHVFGREPHFFYDRVQLPEYVSGASPWAALQTATHARLAGLNVRFHAGRTITEIDRDRQVIIDDRGGRHGYSRLVLATGSRAYLPPGIPALPGVFTLRNRSDADRLRLNLHSDSRVVVLGGGLLGVELAAALQLTNVHCTIIERAPRLLHDRLDPPASQLLREALERYGVHVVVEDVVEGIRGSGFVEGVHTARGREIPCDVLMVAAGTRANVDLAASAGLEYGSGVFVNEGMRTSDPNIFAIGEVAQFGGRTWHGTPAAKAQARVAAAHVNGDERPRYNGSLRVCVVKIRGLDIRAAGEVPGPQAGYDEVVLSDRGRRVYKRCVIYRDRLVGTVMIGDSAGFDYHCRLIESGEKLADRRGELLTAAHERHPHYSTSA